MNHPQSNQKQRHQDLMAAANRILAMPEAGAITTEMALRSATIGRWTLRSQCVLALQEQATGISIAELDTRDGWARRGRVPIKGSAGLYIFSGSRGERTAFPVWERSQTRAFGRSDSAERQRHSRRRTWLRTLGRDLKRCGYELQLTEGPATYLAVEGHTVTFTAAHHRDPAALAALAQCCAVLFLEAGPSSRPPTWPKPAPVHSGAAAAPSQAITITLRPNRPQPETGKDTR